MSSDKDIDITLYLQPENKGITKEDIHINISKNMLNVKVKENELDISSEDLVLKLKELTEYLKFENIY